jgi:hypothetical protein
VSGAFSQLSRHHKKLISRLAAWAGSRIGDRYIRALLFVMLGNCILILGFALGYGVRGWAFRQSDCAGQRRRRMANRRPGLSLSPAQAGLFFEVRVGGQEHLVACSHEAAMFARWSRTEAVRRLLDSTLTPIRR